MMRLSVSRCFGAPRTPPGVAAGGTVSREPAGLTPYFGSAAMVAGALLVGTAIDRFVELPNISIVFLAAVLASAIRYGLRPSLFASILGVLCYNFFFTEPRHTLLVAQPANILALVFFLIAAVLTSKLAARAREQAVAARHQARTTAALHDFSRKLANLATVDDLLQATAHQIFSMLKLDTVALMPEDERLAVRAAWPPEDVLGEVDLTAAGWTWAHDRPAGRGTATLANARYLFLPLRTARGPIGVVGIGRDGTGPLLTPDGRRLVDALTDQAAIAVDRTRLAEDVDEARIAAETERLRTALLTSISHDLRTPLASIIGAISSLRAYGRLYDDAMRDETMATVQDEAERLNRFVGNLLDMTRLDSGAVEPRRASVDLADLVGTALQGVSKMLARHRVEVEIEPDLPMVALDFVLAEQVLINLLDNAAKYAPEGSMVRILVRQGDRQDIRIEVEDEGPGIPPHDLEHVFEKFYRVQSGDRRRAGTGLGLAICRGFVEAMSGRISARNRTDRCGAVFSIVLPGGGAGTVEPAAGGVCHDR